MKADYIDSSNPLFVRPNVVWERQDDEVLETHVIQNTKGFLKKRLGIVINREDGDLAQQYYITT